LFKNYHVVIFKDREGGFRNLRLRGWLGVLLFLLVAALAGTNVYLLRFYSKSFVLEQELEESQKNVRAYDSQLLNLAGKLQTLEENLQRVQHFDTKLRILVNIDKETGGSKEANEEASPPQTSAGVLNNSAFLARHRELFIRRTHSLVDELAGTVTLEEVAQQTLMNFLRVNKDTLLSTPSIWPTQGFLTSGFGWRRSPFSGSGSMHKGLDISNRIGTPVLAPARGTVSFAGQDGSYGLCLMIDHGNNIVTRYAHLQRTIAQAGQYVQRGDVIATLGNTGRSTGPHLHYEVIVGGIPVDPMRYILN
jgi:murein DD-endopeptidase MepM/ murein hydrolase activator NlpD